MAPLPVISNTVRCALNWNAVNGVTPINVLHLFTATTDEEEIGTALGEALELRPECFGLLMANHLLQSITVTRLDGTSAAQVIPMTGITVQGQGGGNQVPAVAAVISFHTAQRGPRGRGRLYIGPMGEADIDGGLVAAGPRTDAVTAWTGLQNDLQAGPLLADIVVASYVHAEQNVVSSFSMRPQCGTMRRRQDQLV